MKLYSLKYLIKEGLRSIFSHSLLTITSIAVLVSCLLITGAAMIISLNVRSLISSIGDDNMMTVYLDDSLSDTEAIKLGNKIAAVDNVAECSFYSRTKALEEYRETLGNIFSAVENENPLQNAYHITLADLSKYKETIKTINNIEGVDTISDRSEVARLLTKLNNFVTLVSFWLIIVLGIVTLFIISNAIRMTVYSRRSEISIMKSVGATNAFVRLPFLIEAMVIGLLSGVIASGILFALYNPALDIVTSIVAMIKDTAIPLSDIWLPFLLTFSAAGMLIGLIGGFISVAKYLNKESRESLEK
ncbi:MAG: permease-like cell division protein FtsX, partial [Acutalibacteraceae bacterium]